MGFRKNAFATVWNVELVKDTVTRGRISISRKNKNTGEYESDFNGFVSFLGTGAASKAAKLKEKDRIKLTDIDVTRKYDKEEKKEYINFLVFDFETVGSKENSTTESVSNVNNEEVDDSDYPF